MEEGYYRKNFEIDLLSIDAVCSQQPFNHAKCNRSVSSSQVLEEMTTLSEKSVVDPFPFETLYLAAKSETM